LNLAVEEVQNQPLSLPLIRNSICNLAICTDCHIALPFDWIKGHMKDSHGLKCNENQILQQLQVTNPTMTFTMAKNWCQEHEILQHPIEGIPVLSGFGCSTCSYSGKKAKTIFNHIYKIHCNESIHPIVVKRKVQKLFSSAIKQYIQVTDENQEEEPDIPDWKEKLTADFNGMMSRLNATTSSEGLDLRLMNAFIAKIRHLSL